MRTPSDGFPTAANGTSTPENPGYCGESRVVIKRSRQTDVTYVASRLRTPDKLDLRGKPAVTMLNHGLWESEDCLTLHVDGKPTAMFGVVPVKRTKTTKRWISSDIKWGAIWLLGTDDIQKISWHFLRESKPVLKYLTATYDLVFNWVHEDNTVHIKWIKWLGFEFMNQQGPFLQFAKVPCVHQ